MTLCWIKELLTILQTVPLLTFLCSVNSVFHCFRSRLELKTYFLTELWFWFYYNILEAPFLSWSPPYCRHWMLSDLTTPHGWICAANRLICVLLFTCTLLHASYVSLNWNNFLLFNGCKTTAFRQKLSTVILRKLRYLPITAGQRNKDLLNASRIRLAEAPQHWDVPMH